MLKKMEDSGFIDNWKIEQEESFKTMKKALTETPTLIHPDFEKDFILSTDASGYALGAVLEQEGNDKKLHPVDRKSTRLNSSHTVISYAVFCLKKKKYTTPGKTIPKH